VLKKSLRLAGEIWRKHVRRKVPSHALLDFNRLSPADHDGATRRSEALFYYFRLEVLLRGGLPQ
jgi:hypothetical protein